MLVCSEVILRILIRLIKSIIFIVNMHKIDINHEGFRRLDLNLLVAFDALLTECHVGRAAERLFIGQPAMSHALARLRTLLDDELLVRTGKGMEPTDLAKTLGPRVKVWLNEVLGFLREEPFDPANAQGVFRLSIPDGLETLVLPALMTILRAEAPGLSIRVVLLEVDQLLQALDADEVDLALVAVDLPLKSWHQREEWLRSHFNYVYSNRHVKLARSPSLAALAACDHVASSYRGEAGSIVDRLFSDQGLNRNVVATLGSLSAVRDSLRRAPLVTIQPDLYAHLLDLPDLTIRPLRSDPPISISIGGVWHSRYANQALHRYVRSHIQNLITQLRQPPYPATGAITRG